MKKIFVLLTAALLFLSGGVHAEGTPCLDETWDLVRRAYVFSFPLVLMDATMKVGTNTLQPENGRAPVNQAGHARTLATARFRQVVTPNVDTLYTQIFFDLSDDALVIRKPAAERYLTFQVMDAWSDTVAMLGAGADTMDERVYLLTGPCFEGEIPEGMTRVDIPTNIGWIIGRTVCFGPEDLENVYDLQAQMDVRTLALYLSGEDQPRGTYVPENDGVPFRIAAGLGPKAFFDRVNELLVLNPAYPEDAGELEAFEAIGVGPGLVFDPAILGDGVGERWQAMIAALPAELTVSSASFLIDNGAFRFMGGPISRFGKEYDYRALVAIGGFGANPADAAVYMRAGSDDEGDELNGRYSYTLHFEPGALPPVTENGFWSVTAYGDDDFLIDNPIDRYAVCDRTAFVLNPDGSLDILVQSEKPEEGTDNWLPVGKEAFHLFLRIYLPQAQVLDGTWRTPSIVKR
ncbi:MAG: DUF1254 domain-containing protein [Clostridia bacterium]|nr:DUF1254 domain-containing protein [Clostridia bacterium]